MSIEAMKQALDALERGRSQIIGALVQQDQDDAITTLRQAIEAAERQEPKSLKLLAEKTGINFPVYYIPTMDDAIEAEKRDVYWHAIEGILNEYGLEAVDFVADFKAALKAAEKQTPVAWRTFDGEGGYEYRSYDDNESYADDWNKRNPNHKGWVEPLYIHSQEEHSC